MIDLDDLKAQGEELRAALAKTAAEWGEGRESMTAMTFGVAFFVAQVASGLDPTARASFRQGLLSAIDNPEIEREARRGRPSS